MSKTGVPGPRPAPKPASPIRRWADWPDDVRAMLREWNWRQLLRFGHRPAPFWCGDCGTFCAPNPNGDAEVVNGVLCDDCLIARAWRRPPGEFVEGGR